MTKHYFNIEVAKELGVNAAIVFENLSFWIDHNSKTGRNEREGTYWMYATQKDIAAQFEYLSIKQTRTALEKLAEYDYIKTGVFNRHGYDRTRWYALTEKGETMLLAGKTDLPSKAKEKVKKGTTIPDNKKIYKIKNIDPDRIANIRRLCGIV